MTNYMQNYAPLHVHTTTGSVGDSVLKIDDYIKKAKALGLTHIAITDHGSMAAMVEFHEKCEEASMTGIIGLEAYVVDDRTIKDNTQRYQYSHLILLAKNEQGVKNLLHIHNDAQLNGFYYKPRTDMSVLKQYGKDIIATSACIQGEIPKAILSKDFQKAISIIRSYQDVFDEFYLELQPCKLPEQLFVNDVLVALSQKMNVPLVATNDVHYLNHEDYIMHDLHVKSNRGNNDIEDYDPQKLVYGDTCFYLMGRDELKASFTRTKYVTDAVLDEALDNTMRIAKQCDGKIDYHFEMPRYPDLPKGETEVSYLTKTCVVELKKREQTLSEPMAYADRLDKELRVISKLGFCGYFLIVQDLLHYAKTHGAAVGPGRGSVGGSLVAWLLGITTADPIKYNLMFERFLTEYRKGLPDVDIDFSDTDKMKDYVIHKYGENHYALVGTFGTRAAKDSIRSAARLIYNVPADAVRVGDEICKAAPYRVTDEHGERVNNPTLEQMLEASDNFQEKQGKYPKVFDAALKMQSFPKSVGIHAAGIVISPHDLTEYLPMRRDSKTGRRVSLITKNYIEKIALKYDFLSLSTMSIVDKTVSDTGAKFDLNDDAFFQDPKVWALIGSPNTVGLFQIGTDLYRQRMKRLAPTDLKGLAACLALVRAPSISAGTDEVYMQIREGKREIEKIDPRYDEITKDTNGICIYQEQIMELGQAYGMTMQEADTLRKCISKKKIAQIKAMKGLFFEKATERQIPKATIQRLWEIIEGAGLYSFNASHATSYAIISYLSAWLKTYYPKEFMANVLTNVYVNGNRDEKKIATIVSDCRRMGLSFLPVDVNESAWEFKSGAAGIRIGFCAIKALGEKAVESLMKLRPIPSFAWIMQTIREDAIAKHFNTTKAGKEHPMVLSGYKMPNKKALTVLALAGAFGNENVADILSEIYSVKEKGDTPVPDKITVSAKCDIPWRKGKPEVIEQMLFRVNFLHAPAANLPASGFQAIEIGTSFTASVYINKVKTCVDRRRQKMAFVTLMASDATFEGTIFGSVFGNLDSNLIAKGQDVQIQAKKDKDGSCIIYDVAAA